MVDAAQYCPVTEDACIRKCVRICRNYGNGKVAPIRGVRALLLRLKRLLTR
jgi:hypothetical protein